MYKFWEWGGSVSLLLLLAMCGCSDSGKPDRGTGKPSGGLPLANQTEWDTLSQLNVYLNISKNMAGFVGGGVNGYKSAVPGIIYSIQKSSPINPKAMNLYYLREDSVVSSNTQIVPEFVEKVPKANVANYDFARQLKTVMDRVNDTSLSIFITDGLDPSNGVNQRFNLENPIFDAKKRAGGKNLHIRVYRLYSAYTGNFVHGRNTVCFQCLQQVTEQSNIQPERAINNEKISLILENYSPPQQIRESYSNRNGDDRITVARGGWINKEWSNNLDGKPHNCAVARLPVERERSYYVWIIGREHFVDGAALSLRRDRMADLAKMQADSIKAVDIPEKISIQYRFLDTKGENSGSYDILNDSTIANLKRMCWGKGGLTCAFDFLVGVNLADINTDISEFKIYVNDIELEKSGFKVKWSPSKDGNYTHTARFSAPNATQNDGIDIKKVKIAIPRNKWWLGEVSVGNWAVYDSIVKYKNINEMYRSIARGMVKDRKDKRLTAEDSSAVLSIINRVVGDTRKTYRLEEAMNIIRGASGIDVGDITITLYFE